MLRRTVLAKRWSIRGTGSVFLPLEDRQNISGGIFEPGYLGALVTPMNTLLVCLEVWLIVFFKTHATPGEFINGDFNILNRKIQYGEGGWSVVWFRIHQYHCPARDVQLQ